MSVRLGKDTIVSQAIRWRYPEKCSVGDYSIIDDFCYISCALSVGRFSHIAANCTFLGGGMKVQIGDFVNVGPGCRIASASHSYATGGLSGPTIPKKWRGVSIAEVVTIRDHCLLGAQTVVLPGVYLPVGVASGAFTLFTSKQQYRPWTLYVGVPARPVRIRESHKILIAAERMLNELSERGS